MTRLRVSWWLAVAQVCLWLDWPRGVVAALDYAARAMPSVTETDVSRIEWLVPVNWDDRPQKGLLGRDDKPVFPDTDE